MSATRLPVTLVPALTSREGIADSIYRCVLALDTNDPDLLRSAFTNDAIFDLNGTIMDGFESISTQCAASIFSMDTTHFITNLRINIRDDNCSADATCSALAQHYRGGKGMDTKAVSLLAGSLYWSEIIKDTADELWKIKRLTVKTTWAQGDWAVFDKEI